MNIVYDKIIEQVNNNSLTGKELGNKLGLKKSPLTDWKNGKSKPTLEQLVKLCEIFAISSDELLGLETANKLSENEKELLSIFKQLPEREQIKFIGKAEDYLEKYKEK
jgi:transcriptional regulator with XRE-family HTH domain